MLGVTGTFGFVALAVAMQAYRPVFEPILRLLLPYIAGRMGNGFYRYDPSRYEFWACTPIFFASIWFVTALIAFVTKPGVDRGIDLALQERLKPTIRGAPLERD